MYGMQGIPVCIHYKIWGLNKHWMKHEVVE